MDIQSSSVGGNQFGGSLLTPLTDAQVNVKPSPLPSPTSPTDGRNSSSPPPNCAICLGQFVNKCFSDSCMHQFCFNCLLEWSKVKAVCPLCKQPFRTIIHNVRSNQEYDQHFVDLPVSPLSSPFDFLLPNPTRQGHFQFRTTFTVDPRGELAIQQLLSTHPLTFSIHRPMDLTPRHTTTSMLNRRRLYDDNLWLVPMPMSHPREITPEFFERNPRALDRIQPWLTREFEAIVEGRPLSQQLSSQTLRHLQNYNLRGHFMQGFLRRYLGQRTDHFTHEFYHFLISPFDMLGFDSVSLHEPQRMAPLIELDDDDDDESDVPQVIPNARLLTQEVVNVDSSDDSDLIMRTPTPPVVVDLLNTTDDPSDEVNNEDVSVVDLSSKTMLRSYKLRRAARKHLTEQRTDSSSESDVTVNNARLRPSTSSSKRLLPPKMRYKRKLQPGRKRLKKDCHYSDSESSTSSSNSSDHRTGSGKQWKLILKYCGRSNKNPRRLSRETLPLSSSSTGNTSDDEPLALRKKWKQDDSINLVARNNHESSPRIDGVAARSLTPPPQQQQPPNHTVEPKLEAKAEQVNTSSDCSRYTPELNISTHPIPVKEGATEARNDNGISQHNTRNTYNDFLAGPSYTSKITLKRENHTNNWWSARPPLPDSDSD